MKWTNIFHRFHKARTIRALRAIRRRHRALRPRSAPGARAHFTAGSGATSYPPTGLGGQQRGLALITAMLVIAIAVTAVTYMAFNQSVWMHQAQNLVDRAQADTIGYNGILWAIDALAEDAKKSNVDTLKEDWSNNFETKEFGAEGGTLEGKIFDAQAKFNLNSILGGPPQAANNIQIMRQILGQVGQDQNLVEAMLDWVDADSDTRPNYGAEDIDYLNAIPPNLPYRAANQAFTSVDELRLVRGFDAATVDALKELVTALPVQAGTTPINVNTADANVLRALFPPLTDSDAKKFIDDGPYNDTGAVTTELGKLIAQNPKYVPPVGTFDVKSAYFEVVMNVKFGKFERSTQALLYRPAAGTPAAAGAPTAAGMQIKILQIGHPIIPKPKSNKTTDSDSDGAMNEGDSESQDENSADQ